MPTLPVISLLHFKPCFFLDILPFLLPPSPALFALVLLLTIHPIPFLPHLLFQAPLPPHPMHLPQSELDISALPGGLHLL